MNHSQALNHTTEDIFTTDRLVLLRDAVVDVFTIFQGLIEKPVYNYNDVKTRLDAVDESKWQTIRAKFLDREHTGEFTKEEKNTVIFILLKFMREVDKCTTTITNKLEKKDSDTLTAENRVRELEVKVRAVDDVLQSTKSSYSQKCSEISGLVAKNVNLQDLINEKSRRITELEKSSNVMLWEREQKRILKESDDRITALENELAELKSGRESYKRRLSHMDETNKRNMMKAQILNQRSPVPSEGDSDDLCRRNFILDKDVSYLEKELYDLQTNTVGVIGGIKTDFHKLTHKIVGEPEVNQQFEQLSSRMDKVYHAVSEGKTDKMAEALPPHYRYIENSNFRVKRIRRLSHTAVVPPQRVINTMVDEKKSKKAGLNGIEEDQQNPVIINTKTKKLHAINPIKHFPHMSQRFILDQYEHFTEYDTNQDNSLDLTEMVKVVSKLGFDITAHEVQEAMEEVDMDHNHTLDFYEYLITIDNIYKRKGKSELFRKGLNEMNKKNLSKACVIQ